MKIKVNRSQLSGIIEERVRKLIEESFDDDFQPKTNKLEIIQESSTPQPISEELYDYFALDGSWCGIKNRIFIDEQESYKHLGHPLWVYVEFENIKIKNPNAYYACLYLPITVERNPRVVGNIDHFNINPKIINNVKRFVSGNVKWFKDIADQKIHRTTHRDKLKPIFMLKENREMLLEMANIPKSKSGLTVNIWVDQGHDLQHGDRIKFQNDNGDRFNRGNSCTLMLHSNMDVVGKPKIHSWEIEQIRTFVKINMKNIISLFKKEIDIDEFENRIVAFNKKGNTKLDIKPDNSEWEIVPKTNRSGISFVKSNSGKYNYLKNGKLLTNYWFDEVKFFQQSANGNLAAFAKLNGVWYQVDINGNVSKYTP